MTEAPRAGAPSELDIEAAHWFFQNSVDVFALLRGGQIARINPAWPELTGWTAEETLGRRIQDFVLPADHGVLQDIITDLRANGHARGEHRILHRDGHVIWVRSRAKRALSDATVIVLEDVTDEHKRRQDADDASRVNELLRETCGIMFWRFDPETGRYLVDPDLSRPGGLGVVGNRALSLEQMTAEVHPEDLARMTRAFSRSMTTGEPMMVEYRHATGEGQWASFRTAWRGLRQCDSGAWMILGMTQDVTEVADARDAALAAAEAKAQFLANMSHEIRAPMNGVLGVLHLLKGEALSPDGRRLL